MGEPMSNDRPFPLTAALGASIAALKQVPARAREIAAMGIADAVGVMFAAAQEPVVRVTRELALEGAPQGVSSVLLSATRTRTSDATFINSVAAHALAMDDVAIGCHPSSMLMPALLAQGEALGASGAQVLDAYVAGYEVLAELAAREPDALHSTGWHPTGLLGPVAVAGAVGHLLGLDAQQMAHALGIAASMTGGLQGNFGTSAKAFHVGRASTAGLLAARLAQRGVDAASDALEAPKGLLRTISPKERVDLSSPLSAKREPRIVTNGLSIKKYPVCYSTHRVADAAIDIARQPGFALDDVERVEVAIGTGQAAMARHQRPRTSLEARYSVEFTVASGLVAQAAGFAQLQQGFIDLPAVQRLLSATSVTRIDERSTDDPIFSPSDRVRVFTRSGRVFDSGEVRYPRGHAQLPVSTQELRTKFVDCAQRGGFADAGPLFDRLMNLAALGNVREIAGAR